ncbi:MAG: UDP-N-acetylmuramoyl-L-alanine--D-glutamate ligase [Pseudobdellovibrionaceae bacterium]
MRQELQHLNLELPIAIIGLGLSGDSALRLLLAAGIDRSQILTFDQKSPADFQDDQNLINLGKPRTLCVSPGISLALPWIQEAIQKGTRLTSELEIAFAFITGEKVIAITGALGKSTTTSILGAGVSAIDPNAFVGGNLGFPLANYSTDLISGNRNRAQYVLLELSSYQLENFRNLSCDAAILTHLSPNHLERYRNLSHYFDTKISLFKYTKQVGILNRSGGDIESLSEHIQEVNPSLHWVLTDRHDDNFKSRIQNKPKLVGSHNLDNLALAFAVAEHFSWPQECFNSMLRFPGLSHRLENCGTVQNILFINDSKATSIQSVLQALDSVSSENSDRLIHLLIGGKDKDLPWEDLRAAKNKNVRFYFFGEVGPKAKQKSQLEGELSPKLADCLSLLKTKLAPGDIVLLSPGGTSWDEFKNFEERGQFFKNWILSEFQSHKG